MRLATYSSAIDRRTLKVCAGNKSQADLFTFRSLQVNEIESKANGNEELIKATKLIANQETMTSLSGSLWRLIRLAFIFALFWASFSSSLGSEAPLEEHQTRSRRSERDLWAPDLGDGLYSGLNEGYAHSRRSQVFQRSPKSRTKGVESSDEQPPNELVFSNSTGAVVHCGLASELIKELQAADIQLRHIASDAPSSGDPEVRIKWEKDNGDPLDSHSIQSSSYLTEVNERRLRYVRPTDGALVFEAFKPSEYRADVHASTYRCSASSPSRGASIVSSDMRVKALVAPQTHTPNNQLLVEVLDELVIEGNTALFRCQIPSFAADYLQVVEWLEYPSEVSLTLKSTTMTNAAILFSDQNSTLETSNYYMNPKSGDLHIIKVESSANYRSYKCRCKNRLTGELVSSVNRGKLIVTESHSAVAPRMLAESPALQSQKAVYEEGEVALLSCNMQSNPRATVTWFKRINELESEPIVSESTIGVARTSGAKYAQLAGGLLLINRLNRNDSATYHCLAKNSVGEERAQVELPVRGKLRAKLKASANVLELGKSLALECSVSGYPIHQVVFRHNQNIIKSISGSTRGQPQSKQQTAAHLAEMAARRTAGEPDRYHYSNQQLAEHRKYHQPQTSASSYFVLDNGSPAALTLDQTDGGQAKRMDLPQAQNASNYLEAQAPELSKELEEESDESRLSHVIVIVLEPEHAGAYQCFAYNQYESVHSSAYIRVLEDPPKFKDTFKSQVLEQRQDLSLQCSARASPLPAITWSIDDQPIVETTHLRVGDFVTKDNLVISFVNISQLQVTDSGLYRCTADNGLAQLSHQAQISVLGPVQVKPMSNVTAVASTTFRIRCPVAGYPIGDIQWQHNGRRLPANHRQHVYENGTLVVEHMERSQGDDGHYLCLVSGDPMNERDSQARNAPVASGSLHLSIKVKPSIEPFAISKSLREGQRASITCTMSSGDLPISISWFHNGLPVSLESNESSAGAQTPQVPEDLVSSNRMEWAAAPPKQGGVSRVSNKSSQLSGVRVSRVSDYSSTLLFESLLAQHSGNYTCLASNDAGSVSHEAPMVVQVAPKWSLEPSDINVIRGSSLSIDCMASGFPPPRIIWTKANVESAATLGSTSVPPAAIQATTQSISQQQQSHHLNSWVYENGSLNMLDARDSDAGHYMCQASNGVGPGLSKVIRVTINVPAQFNTRHSVQFVNKAEQISLRCQAKGDWPLQIHWFKNRHKLEPVNIQDAPLTSYGTQSVAGLQSQPISSTVGSVILLNSPLSSQEKFAKIIKGLTVNDNSGNASPFSLADSPADQTGAGGGLLMQRYSLSSSEFVISPNGKLPIQSDKPSFTIHEKTSLINNQQPVIVQLNSMLTISQTERADTGPFKCFAINQFGMDERTIQLIVQEQPDRVEDLSVLEVSSRSVTLGWLAPFDGNAPISNYHVQYQMGANQQSQGPSTSTQSPTQADNIWQNYSLAVNGEALNQQQVFASSQLSTNFNANHIQLYSQHQIDKSSPNSPRSLVKLTIGNLKPVSHYWFRVEAENKLGRGPVSAPIESVTMEEAPSGAPAKLKAVAQSSSSILVSWSRLNEREVFGQVQGYYVAYKPLSPSPSSAPSVMPPELTTSTSFVTSTATTDERGLLTEAQLSTVTNIYKTIQHDDKLTKFDALLTGLKRSTRYMISVQAFNARGTGPSTEPVIIRTLDMDPPKQVKLFVKQSSNCTIELEWRPLSQAALLDQTSKHELTSYENKLNELPAPLAMPLHIEQQVQPAAADSVDYYSLFQAELIDRPRTKEIRLPGNARSYTAEELRCGTRYQFYMVAVNKIGQGDQSDILDTRTVGGLPLAPDRQSTFDVINTTCYVIRLDHWQDNGCPIREFKVKYKQESAVEWTQLARFDLPLVDSASSLANDLVHEAGKTDRKNDLPPAASLSSGKARAFLEDELMSVTRPLVSKIRGIRSASDRGDDVYIFNTEDGRDDEDSFLDYTVDANVILSDNSDDYSNGDSDSKSKPYNESSVDSYSQPADKKLFNLLRDSMLPNFPSSDLTSSHLDNIRSPKHLPVAQQWQSSNYIHSVRDGNNKVKVDSDQSQDSSKLTRMTSHQIYQTHQQFDWKRVRFCGLNENVFYIIQITASNGVGETEAELRLLTSLEGLEYDQEIKRQVVGKLNGNRMAQSIAMGDKFNIFSINQWPVLVSFTLTVTIMCIIVLISLLIRRTNSSGSTSTSTTTTTTGMNDSNQRQNYPNSGHHHIHRGGAMSSFKGAAEVSMSSDGTTNKSNNMDVYDRIKLSSGVIHSDQHHDTETIANMSIYQHRASESLVDEPSYGVLGLTQLFNQNSHSTNSADNTNRSSSSPATTTAAATSLNSGSSGQKYFGPSALKGRNVYLCSNSNPKTIEETHGNDFDTQMFYNVTADACQQQAMYTQQHLSRQHQGDRLIMEQVDNGSRQMYKSGNELYTGIMQQQNSGLDIPNGESRNEPKLDTCFLNIVEEVARANESLRNPNEIEKTLESRANTLPHCNQADCLNQMLFEQQNADRSVNPNYTQTVRALVGECANQLDKQVNGSNQNLPTTDQLMFDPVYATIRRTFPQAFRYLTLQHNHQIQQQHQQQQQQQHPSNDQTIQDKLYFEQDNHNKPVYR